MCVEYELNGKKIDYLPASVEDQLKIKPIYKTFQGWKKQLMELKILMNFQRKQKIIFMQLRTLWEQKYQVSQQVQKEMIQF